MLTKPLALTLAAALVLAAARRRAAGRRAGVPAAVRIVDAEGAPLIDETGGARSVQAAELVLAPAQLEALWSATGLERLARTYWRFLPRVSLGLIQVRYTETERLIVLVGRPLVLLSFQAPDYELDAERGAVRWQIRGGLLLARGGLSRRGSLQIALRRLTAPGRPAGSIHVEVAVTDFVPAVAGLFGRRVYAATQSRIHVIVTHAFLRSLDRLDLARAPAGPHLGG